jgi:hypothetical protein
MMKATIGLDIALEGRNKDSSFGSDPVNYGRFEGPGVIRAGVGRAFGNLKVTETMQLLTTNACNTPYRQCGRYPVLNRCKASLPALEKALGVVCRFYTPGGPYESVSSPDVSAKTMQH